MTVLHPTDFVKSIANKEESNELKTGKLLVSSSLNDS